MSEWMTTVCENPSTMCFAKPKTEPVNSDRETWCNSQSLNCFKRIAHRRTNWTIDKYRIKLRWHQPREYTDSKGRCVLLSRKSKYAKAITDSTLFLSTGKYRARRLSTNLAFFKNTNNTERRLSTSLAFFNNANKETVVQDDARRQRAWNGFEESWASWRHQLSFSWNGVCLHGQTQPISRNCRDERAAFTNRVIAMRTKIDWKPC